MIEKQFTVSQMASGDLIIYEGQPMGDYVDQYGLHEFINEQYHVKFYFRIMGLAWLEFEFLLVLVNDYVNEYGFGLVVGEASHLAKRKPYHEATDATKLATVIDPKHPFYGAQVRVKPYHKYSADYVGEYYWLDDDVNVDVFMAYQLGDMYPPSERE